MAMGTSVGFADDFPENSYAVQMSKFVKTDTNVECIKRSHIRTITVLDSSHILFKLRNDNYVLNELARNCKELRPDNKYIKTLTRNKFNGKNRALCMNNKIPISSGNTNRLTNAGQYDGVVVRAYEDTLTEDTTKRCELGAFIVLAPLVSTEGK